MILFWEKNMDVFFRRVIPLQASCSYHLFILFQFLQTLPFAVVLNLSFQNPETFSSSSVSVGLVITNCEVAICNTVWVFGSIFL